MICKNISKIGLEVIRDLMLDLPTLTDAEASALRQVEKELDARHARRTKRSDEDECGDE